jgi:hypothetical protein
MDGRAGAADFADAENTENRCANCLLWQEGHSGSALPITSFSKLLLQSLQTYSKMGIRRLYVIRCRLAAAVACAATTKRHYK